MMYVLATPAGTFKTVAIPLKNEWWQLTTCLGQLGLGQVEKAKKLFNLSIQDSTARAEARAAFGDDAIEHYLHTGMIEQTEYDKRITDWELRRYFERG